MANSWRIQTNFDNRSQRSLPSAGTGLGATVVRSKRGRAEPVYFAQGESQKILNILGVPTADNPELLEAIEYNKSYPMWISSPSNGGKLGGVLIGTDGSETLVGGVEEGDITFSNVALFTTLTHSTGDIFTGTLGHLDQLILAEGVAETLELYVDGEVVTISYTDTEGTYSISGTTINSGTLTIDTGEISIEFNEGEVDENSFVETKHTVDLSEDYYALLTTVAGSDESFLQVMNSEVTVNDDPAFEMAVQMKNVKGKFVSMVDSPIQFSLDPDHENGFGVNIYAGNVFEDSNYFVAHVNTALTYSAFTDDEAYVPVSGGTRGMEVGDTEFTAGYEYFKQTRKYPINVFFDASQNEAVPTAFSDLRTNANKYARYILPVPDMTITEAIDWTMPVSDRGISFYFGYFLIRNPYSSAGRVRSIPMGEVAKKHADIMLNAFGGLAPAWFDENGMGGQLTGGRLIESIYDPTEDQLKSLDEARINPIVLDPAFGAMITSRRTSVSGSLSDWSFIGYSGAMDYILKNLSEQVLPYQIVKMNDPIHRNIVRSKTNSILQPMTTAPNNVIRNYLVKCDSENNNDEVKAREEFRLDVAVQFTPKSRTIHLTFINTPQNSTVEEMFE